MGGQFLDKELVAIGLGKVKVQTIHFLIDFDMEKSEIYSSLLVELKKVAYWCKNPSEQENFDIDIVYKNIFIKYKISMKYGFLYPIFSLVDSMCDSIRHNQKEIVSGYTVTAGILDLERIIKLIEQKEVDELENNYELKKKTYKSV